MTQRNGQCMCGAVSFAVADMPDRFGACYCDMCRRWAGSALVGAFVARDGLTIEGAEHITRFQSSDWAERAFCSRCGSGLWYGPTQGDHAAYVSMPIGLFHDTTGLTMVHEYYIDKRPAAFDYPAGRKQLTEAETMALFAPAEV